MNEHELAVKAARMGGSNDVGFGVNQMTIGGYLLVDTSNWIGGVHVLVPTDLVGSVHWIARRLTVADTVERIRAAPRYDSDRALDSTLEHALNRHYQLDSRAQSALASARGAVG